MEINITRSARAAVVVVMQHVACVMEQEKECMASLVVAHAAALAKSRVLAFHVKGREK